MTSLIFHFFYNSESKNGYPNLDYPDSLKFHICHTSKSKNETTTIDTFLKNISAFSES